MIGISRNTAASSWRARHDLLGRFEFSHGITVKYWFCSSDIELGVVHYWKLTTSLLFDWQQMTHEDLALFFEKQSDLELLEALP